nr:hypothetical protein [Sulfurimonas sp. MAG313]
MTLEYLFSYKLSKLSVYVDKQHLDTLQMTFSKEIIGNKDFLSLSHLDRLIFFLFNSIRIDIEEAKKNTALVHELRKQLSYCASDFEKKNIILDYAYRFDPSKKQRQKDELAFKRWFDEDALFERITSKISSLHRRVIIALDRIQSSVEILQEEQKLSQLQWDSFDFNTNFLEILQYREVDLLTDKTFSVLINVVQYFGIDENFSLLDEKLFRFIYKVSLSTKQNVWIQNHAIEFLRNTQLASFISIVKIRSIVYDLDDSIFVRHKIIELIVSSLSEEEELIEILNDVILKDPSSYVRQGLAKQLCNLDASTFDKLKEELILHDKEKSVRALAVLQIIESFKDKDAYQRFRILFWRSFENEKESFVLKTILFSIRSLAEKTMDSNHPDTNFLNESFERLSSFIVEQNDVSLKRYAAMVREFIWVCMEGERYTRYTELFEFVQNISPSKGQILPTQYKKIPVDELYRIFSIVAQNDFSLELKYGFFGRVIVYRSERFGRRLWRILYEFFNPSPDKRQAFLHTIARVFEGNHHFPSAILAEQAPTKVPGEPYYIPEEESWRPYLPLLDHFLSSLKQPSLRIHPYEIYSSDGITKIEVPKLFLKRFKMELILSWNYAKLSRLRNWQISSTQTASSYISQMQKLGFKVSFKPYVKDDKSTMQFFPVGLPFLSADFQESLGNYFVSAYENSLSDLVLFLGLVFTVFFMRHFILSKKIKKARKNIPLSIGGWGTRGKSGTERLKAALFNSLGLRVFSKTTGNEAMFLHSDSFELMREMYFFRPYDKATIWEQANAVMLAQKLGVDVFLWESMGLTPSYVEILQQQWMKDDIATITNTYPDHEDLQGPAGINIPQVMTKFIPENSILISSEEVMYPILKAHARKVHTSSYQVGWLEAGLISPDILNRFEYEEHPYNIALVLRMAKELEINEDEALKAMADNIVPDLGVLKAYPSSCIDNRWLVFINGMSANERFGTLGNWKRISMDKIDDEKEPEVFITTIINNRADRVSRSRVFASLMIEDIVADCHILIGSNLSGLNNYIEESWKNYQKKLSIIKDEINGSQDKLMQYAKKFRLIRNDKQLKNRLRIMLDSKKLQNQFKDDVLTAYMDIDKLQSLLEKEPEIFSFYKDMKLQYNELLELYSYISQNKDNGTLDKVFKEQLWKWLKRRIVTVADFNASGNEIIHVISQHTPPGMINKIMGMQNIKGTGLDLAYRFVAWDQCYKMCMNIHSDDSKLIRQGIDALATFDEHGPLTFSLVSESIEIAKSAVSTQNELYQAQIKLIEERVDLSKKYFLGIDKQNVYKVSSSKFWHQILYLVESFLDAGDAVKRRKESNRIYEDLVSHQISHKRAALALKEITKRQKGGWFTQKFEKKGF